MMPLSRSRPTSVATSAMPAIESGDGTHHLGGRLRPHGELPRQAARGDERLRQRSARPRHAEEAEEGRDPARRARLLERRLDLAREPAADAGVAEVGPVDVLGEEAEEAGEEEQHRDEEEEQAERDRAPDERARGVAVTVPDADGDVDEGTVLVLVVGRLGLRPARFVAALPPCACEREAGQAFVELLRLLPAGAPVPRTRAPTPTAQPSSWHLWWTDAVAHDWREAGSAWGHAANDWSCFWEHYSTPSVVAMFQRLGVGPGVRLLDVACGSGAVAFLAAVDGSGSRRHRRGGRADRRRAAAQPRR